MIEKLTAKFRSIFAELTSEVAKREKQRKTLAERRDFLKTAPLPPSEIADQVVSLMLRQAKFEFHRHLDAKLAPAVRNPNLDIEAATWRPALLGHVSTPNTVVPGCLVWLLREPLSEAIREAVIDHCSSLECGPPAAEREKEVAELDSDIAKIDGELAALKQHARASGVDLQGAGHETVEEKRLRSKTVQRIQSIVPGQLEGERSGDDEITDLGSTGNRRARSPGVDGD